MLRDRLKTLLSHPAAERIGGAMMETPEGLLNIMWDGSGPELQPGQPGHIKAALSALSYYHAEPVA